MIGIDLAKSVFQVHGVDAQGAEVSGTGRARAATGAIANTVKVRHKRMRLSFVVLHY